MLRFGILGAARIAPAALIRPASLLRGVEVVAVAASNSTKARAFADEHNIETTTGSYAALVDSPHVDAVYNALPPNLHERWSIDALNAGKHVLCEKPFAMNAAQARRMVTAANTSERVLIEAFHYRFHPYFQRVLKILDDDVIGKIRHIEAQFDARIPYSASEFRHDPALGGGALMDLGCYPLHWVRTLMACEPQVTRAECVRSESGVDIVTRASLKFGNNTTAEVMTSMSDDTGPQHYARVIIEGQKGRLVLENPVAPHNGNTIIVDGEDHSYDETIAGKSTYFYQLAHFVAAVEGTEKSLTGGKDAIDNMRLIDAIYEAAEFERREID